MLRLELNGREVEVERFGFGPGGEDTYIEVAYYVEDGEPLSEEEIEELEDAYPELLGEAFFERQVEQADYLADQIREN